MNNKQRTEIELMIDAERGSTKQKMEALQELKERFDPTYRFCSDCGNTVNTSSTCCKYLDVYFEEVLYKEEDE